ncbi:MAG: S8 family serine peptidase, partial [Chloroflexi bacterium]|nr:S8 family serine peptidase [Chloroflexota bacterium]
DASEIVVQLLTATAVAILIGRVLGFAFWLARNKTVDFSLGLPFKAVTGFVWLALLAALIFKSNAGFHRDHLFIILSDQADVSAAADIGDIDQRRQFVYDTLTVHANASQEPLRQWLDRFGVNYQPYYLVNAIEVEGGFLLQLWLSRFDGVDRVLHNPELRPLIPLDLDEASLISSEDSPNAPDWNLTMIGADRVWQEFGVLGAGVTLGQSDSGVQWNHPELRDSYRGRDGDHNYDWLDAWENEPAPYDLGGHGTHTTGTVVGNSVGVAPEAEWFACANLVRNLGNPAKYLACMEFMLAPYPVNGNAFTDGEPTLAADVLNNSWGCPTLEGCDPTTLQTAVANLRAAGIFVVASAGNDGDGGCNTVKNPIALYDDSFSVGAHNASGQIAGFSSRGPVTADGSGRVKPDILAPGVGVLSAVPDNSYARYPGTSMAGPHVAGVVALIWSANPSLMGDIDETERILVETAVPYDYAANGVPLCGDANTVPDNAVGYGLVNAYEAVKMALSAK